MKSLTDGSVNSEYVTNINNLKTNSKTIKSRIWKCEEKHLYGYFKRQKEEIAHEMTWVWPRRGNHKKETESLLIAEENTEMRTNCVKGKIDNMQ